MVSFYAQSGKSYYLAVDGNKGAKGLVVLNARKVENHNLLGNASSLGIQFFGSDNQESNEVILNPLSEEVASEHVIYRLQNFKSPDEFRIWRWRLRPWDLVEGAEFSTGVNLRSDGLMPGIQSLIRHSGSKAYYLSGRSDTKSWLFFEKWLYANENSKITWWEFLDDPQNAYHARIEYSLDGEFSWKQLTASEHSNAFDFSFREVSLRELAGKIAKIRFVVNSNQETVGSVVPEADWYLDEIRFSHSHYLDEPQVFETNSETVSVKLLPDFAQVLFAEKVGAAPHLRFSQPRLTFPSSAQNLYDFLDASTEISGFWHYSAWYGYFFKNTNNNWFFSPLRGWQYFGGFTLGGGWIWDSQFGWMWTEDSFYPWLYVQLDGKWIYDYSLLYGERLYVE